MRRAKKEEFEKICPVGEIFARRVVDHVRQHGLKGFDTRHSSIRSRGLGLLGVDCLHIHPSLAGVIERLKTSAGSDHEALLQPALMLLHTRKGVDLDPVLRHHRYVACEPRLYCMRVVALLEEGGAPCTELLHLTRRVKID